MPSLLSVHPGTAKANVFANLRQFGSQPAIISADEMLSFDDVADRIAAAHVLTTQRRLVVIAGANNTESIVAYLAAMAHGHVVLLVPGDNPANLASIVQAYDPDVVYDQGEGFVERRSGTRHELHPDLALLMSTSGSTGCPKLVRLSYDNIVANARSIADYLGIDGSDRAITTLPIHYCYGLSVVNSHLLSGAGLVVTDWSVVDECLWELFTHSRATSFAGVPYTFDLLESTSFAQRDLPSLRYVTQAGGRLPPERVAAFARLGQERGWDFYAMYGQTEATARMAYLPPDLAQSHPHALGVPVPGGSFRLEVAPDAADSGIGELIYRGDNVMMGYASAPADLARGAELAELRTGDLARLGEDGMYAWVGRKSRMAKVFGLRIDLDDVECALAAGGCPARCVSAGDTLHAFVDWQDDPHPARAIMAAHVGLPDHALAVDRLREQPRTTSGKTDYAALERQARLLASSAATARCRSAVPVAGLDHIRNLYAELLARPDATPEHSFASLGGDSLSYVELSVRLAELHVPLDTDWHRRSIRELVSAPSAPKRRGVRLETSIMLRAAGILLVLGTHANLWTLAGGAHVLLVVVGYHFARFQLGDRTRADRVRGGLSSLANLVVPSVVWVGLVALVLGTYDAGTVFFLNGFFGSATWTVQWQFWFLEAIIWTQVAALAVLAVPWVHRAERRVPFLFAMTVVFASLAVRYASIGVEAGPTERYAPILVLWCFAMGWAIAAARSTRQRLIVSLASVLAVPGFFGDLQREAIVVAGILLLVWVDALIVPRWLARCAGALAAASLYVYLTHWQVYPYLENSVPVLAVLSSLAVGIGYRHICEASSAWVRTRARARWRSSSSRWHDPTGSSRRPGGKHEIRCSAAPLGATA